MKQGIAHRPLADMETNGVYFDRDNVIVLEDDEICQYSGLPAVTTYENAPIIEITEAVS